MQVINAIWSAVFGDGRSADEVRTELLGRIVLHNTPGRYDIAFRNPAVFAVFVGKLEENYFYAFVAKKDEWRKTNGDFAPGGVLPQIMPIDAVAQYLEEFVITDGTVIDYARQHTSASSGREAEGFYDKFIDDEHVIVVFYNTHCEAKLGVNSHGAPVLTEALNKTKDLYCVFLPAARIKPSAPGGAIKYEIVMPETRVLLETYNKECARVGRRTV